MDKIMWSNTGKVDLDGPIGGQLTLSYRALGRLEYANVIKVRQLLDMDEWDLRDIPRLGPKILAEIKDELARNGLELKRVDSIQAG